MSAENERRAVWAGWEYLTNIGGYWKNPATGKILQKREGVPDYEHSLDSCVELIEKAKELGWEFRLFNCGAAYTELGKVYGAAIIGEGWPICDECSEELLSPSDCDYAETPSKAICAAVDKLIAHLEER